MNQGAEELKETVLVLRGARESREADSVLLKRLVRSSGEVEGGCRERAVVSRSERCRGSSALVFRNVISLRVRGRGEGDETVNWMRV